MTIYQVDHLGTLSGPVELPQVPGAGILVPEGFVQLDKALAIPKAGFAWAWVDNEAIQLEDHRGPYFSVVDGRPVVIETLGPLPEEVTDTPRPSADHLWDGTAWVVDAEYQQANRQILCSKLCTQIDLAADAARQQVAGDPLRAVEYEKAATEAQAFKDAGYPANAVPRTVSAWAIAGRTAQQSADDILREAAAYTNAFYSLRETRLQAKELVRQAFAAGNPAHAEDIAAETVAAIQASVAGVGNANT